MKREEIRIEDGSQTELALNVTLRVLATGTVLFVLAGVAVKIIFF
ncbi:hypothetical protein [Mucilaginibacter ginkgonis]|nr:hypothetical protein [Mucilaginibacter ginkgonis]